MNSVKDRDGNIIIGKGKVMNRWTEYFQELLNVEYNGETGNHGNISETPSIESEISLQEVRRVVNKLRMGKQRV